MIDYKMLFYVLTGLFLGFYSTILFDKKIFQKINQ